MVTQKKRMPRLGRGLNSLMSSPVQIQVPEAVEEPVEVGEMPSAGDVAVVEEQPTVADVPAKKPVQVMAPNPPAPTRTQEQAGLTYLSVESLRPNRHQPRQRFDEAALKRLADSIASEGIMQPIVARPGGDGAGRYEVVAGERRWRAAQLAGLVTVPVIVRDLNDRQIAEWALIENLQREDLNPIERAEAFSRLIEQFGLSHEEAGARVGMDRSSISNHLRLLGMGEPVKQLISEGLLSMGQARAIAGLSDLAQQQSLAESAVRQGMSVREVEAAVRKLASGDTGVASTSTKKSKPAYLMDLERQIAEQLGTKVQIKTGRKKGTGTLSIDFYSLDQFDTLVGRLGAKTQ